MKRKTVRLIIRNLGLSSGLVDYKVCAIDATWSGRAIACGHNHRHSERSEESRTAANLSLSEIPRCARNDVL
jgi:hypothetical protein